MAKSFNLYSLLLLLTSLILSACVSSPLDDNAGRYDMQNDSPELEDIDLASIPEVIPQAITRTSAGNKSPYQVNGRSYTVMATEKGYEETGIASWYGRKFHGHLTSNGEIYDMFKFSAAHKSLPIPSFARVTNMDNGKSIVVRVNDRGPFHENRIIDLSYAAAAKLDYADLGTARVHVEALTPWVSPPELLASKQDEDIDQEGIAEERELIEADQGQEYLQLGAFGSLASAEGLRDAVGAITQVPAFIRSEFNENSNNTLHRVRLGPLNETIELNNLIQLIIDAGFGTPFKVRQ